MLSRQTPKFTDYLHPYTKSTQMNTSNDIDLNFRAFTDDRDTDFSVSMNAEHADDEKLMKLVNTWFTAIGANLTVRDNRN